MVNYYGPMRVSKFQTERVLTIKIQMALDVVFLCLFYSMFFLFTKSLFNSEVYDIKKTFFEVPLLYESGFETLIV